MTNVDKKKKNVNKYLPHQPVKACRQGSSWVLPLAVIACLFTRIAWKQYFVKVLFEFCPREANEAVNLFLRGKAKR